MHAVLGERLLYVTEVTVWPLSDVERVVERERVAILGNEGTSCTMAGH
jgi:hypothetical protein